MTCQPRFGLCTLILNFRGISSTPRSISLSPFPRKSLTKFRMSWRGPFSMQCQLTFPSMPSPRSSTSGTEGWPSTLWCTSWIWCRDESRARWADFSRPCIWLRCIVNTSSFRLLISWLQSTPDQWHQGQEGEQGHQGWEGWRPGQGGWFVVCWSSSGFNLAALKVMRLVCFQKKTFAHYQFFRVEPEFLLLLLSFPRTNWFGFFVVLFFFWKVRWKSTSNFLCLRNNFVF